MLAAYLISLPLLAQTGGQEASLPTSRAMPRVPVTSVRPRIDGVLEEAAWAQAVELGSFTEVEPEEGRTADPGTRVLLMRDSESLYVAVICAEPEPGEMVLHNMRRDAFLNDDDRIEFLLDTFQDGRTAYWFQMSAAGSRGDALIGDNGQRFNKRWDAFWEGRTRVGPDSWVAEMAIPFKTLSFGAGSTWNFNFERFRGADRSRTRWASPRRELRMFTVSAAAPVTGFDDLDQGLGLELLPYAKLKRLESENPDLGNTLGSFGGEVNWRITPQLTGSLTFNTDFAETEADQRRVNLTRFPLFFPEKRDFFLEDSTLFEFGEQSRFGGGGSNLLPYFSRRIGLTSSGEEVPIDAGARLAGRIDDLDLGLLAVGTGPVPGAKVPSGELFVARPSLRLSEEAAVGALFTHGNPSSDERNVVTGADFRYTSTDLVAGGNFNFNLYGVRSSDEASHEVAGAWGLQSSLNTRDWQHRFSTLSTQSTFAPALGFVRRPGQRNYLAESRWEPRPDNGSSIRKYSFAFRPRLWTDNGGRLQSHGLDLQFLGIEWHTGESLELKVAFDGDRLDQSFSPVAGTTIRKGFHHWWVLESEFETSDTEPVSLDVELRAGGWYNGQAYRPEISLNWRPDASLSFGLSFNEEHYFLPGGDFVSRVGIINADFSFSPATSLQNLVQMDNQSDLLGVQSRLRHIQEDGRELFLVVNAGWQELASGPFVPTSRDITAKVVYSLRF